MAQSDGPAGPRRKPSAWAWPLLGPAVAVLFAAYFLLPARVLGPERPALSWTVFTVVLAAIAALLLKHMRDAMFDRPGTVVALVSLMCLTVLVFSSAYFVISHDPGEFRGLRTRLDALYFTLLTLATLSYSDIVPRGQSARLVIVLQILYTLVFLTAAATSLTGKLRRTAASRPPRGRGPRRG
ncbi:two pore domain potassium channel family protein [Streptomyces smyrnaeus]|uniref:Two pore domain potassium channel family protein n=1 Tax=Streptomyces smyrnaeus TaxID=1387713 RepID=A0ABS3XQA9_9ACTN|nr:potassium channel family protein [Streptomyces smyrnaeus]MBO8197592.1 two pore domain potassium channel family protein [Streptomyces smyrnaeus]